MSTHQLVILVLTMLASLVSAALVIGVFGERTERPLGPDWWERNQVPRASLNGGNRLIRRTDKACPICHVGRTQYCASGCPVIDLGDWM